MAQSSTATQSLDRPAGPPPPDAASDGHDNATEDALMDGVWITALIITTLAVAMRVYSKRFLASEKRIHIEDYLIILAWLTYLALSIMIVPMERYGMGKHMWNITTGDFLEAVSLVEIWSIIYNVTTILVKTAILRQILRVFVPTRLLNLPLYIACCAVGATIVLFYTIMAIINLVLYTSGEINHSPQTGVEKFVVDGGSSLITAIFNACSDFAILLLPLPSIYQLHATSRQKLAIAGLFATGFLACAVSTVRAAVSKVLSESTDGSWTMTKEASFALSELAIAILTFCLPALPPVFLVIRNQIPWLNHAKARSERPDPPRHSAIFIEDQRPPTYRTYASEGSSAEVCSPPLTEKSLKSLYTYSETDHERKSDHDSHETS